jgi:hypothetical protein
MSGFVQKWVAAAILAVVFSTVQSAPVFQGRLADGSASGSCTVSGVTKCTMFYNTTLDITILNDWNIVADYDRARWDAAAGPGSAQYFAEVAGLAATGLTGWMLPTGGQFVSAGTKNQYASIWRDVGSSFEGLRDQFDGVMYYGYWSSTEYVWNPSQAWYFDTEIGAHYPDDKGYELYFVAIRPGDVAPVPEPQTAALALLALGLTAVVLARQTDAGAISRPASACLRP